jgi:hypothetical protein
MIFADIDGPSLGLCEDFVRASPLDHVFLICGRVTQKYTATAQRREKKKAHRRIKAVVSKYLNKTGYSPSIAKAL